MTVEAAVRALCASYSREVCELAEWIGPADLDVPKAAVGTATAIVLWVMRTLPASVGGATYEASAAGLLAYLRHELRETRFRR